MARRFRITAPGIPHHVTQRGSRRMNVFFSNGDFRKYRKILAQQTRRHGVRVWLYCQMPNHVHLIAEPSDESSLSRAIGEAHRLYARFVNRREGWCGHLWQERFRSFPMDELHLLRAIRYVLLNPVRAGLVSRPDDWPHSSARAHLYGVPNDLIAANALEGLVEDWRQFLDWPVRQETLASMRKHSISGHPLGSEAFQSLVGRLP